MEYFLYVQKTGSIFHCDEMRSKKIGSGYAGASPHVNDPQAESLIARGPIPTGIYRINRAFNHVRLGPVSIYLSPNEGNTMFGRSGFFIHGDNSYGNQTASHGCIILPRKIREQIAASGLETLYVAPTVCDFDKDKPF